MTSLAIHMFPQAMAGAGASSSWPSAAGSFPGGLWQKLTGIFHTPTKGVSSLINSREAFKSFFKEQIDLLGATVPPQDQADLVATGEGLMRDILQNSLDKAMDHAIRRGDAKVASPVLKDALARAEEYARLGLMELNAHAARARIAGVTYDTRPQILVRPDQTLVLIRPAPLIENLVLRGGGAKGVGNGPALMEMERAGLLAGVNKIVGTSVGALTAVSLASGQSAQAYSRMSEEQSMLELLTTGGDFEARYPGIDMSWRIGFRSGRALELLDEVSATHVSSYLAENWSNAGFQEKIEALRQAAGETAVSRLAQLRQQDFEVDRTRQMITFQDLALLHQLEPARFKNLVLTGWDNTRRETMFFSAETTPDMSIAVAGRISMAFPVVFKSVTVDPGDGGGARTFSDGGIGSNIPTEVILGKLRNPELADARARTALMTFDDEGEAYQVMHGKPLERSGMLDWLVSKVTGHPDFGQASTNDDIKVGEAGPNAFVVFHGDLGTLSFLASTKRREEAEMQASLKMLEQIEQRSGQAYAVECASIEDCFALLSESEKQQLVRGGPPASESYPHAERDLAYRTQRQLYEMALEGGQRRMA